MNIDLTTNRFIVYSWINSACAKCIIWWADPYHKPQRSDFCGIELAQLIEEYSWQQKEKKTTKKRQCRTEQKLRVDFLIAKLCWSRLWYLLKRITNSSKTTRSHCWKTTTRTRGAIISRFLSTRTLLHSIDPAKSTRGAERDHEFEFSDVTSAAEGRGGGDSGSDGRLRQPDATRMRWAARLGDRSHSTPVCPAVSSWLPARRGYNCGWEFVEYVMCWWQARSSLSLPLTWTGIYQNGLSEAKPVVPRTSHMTVAYGKQL